jgi:hypothetical protein
LEEHRHCHTTPSNGINNYRIRENDKDGRYSYSDIRTLRMSNEAKSFELISNPVLNKTLQIQINTVTEQTIALFSTDGKIIWTKQFAPGIHAVNLNEVPKGIYILSSGDHTEKLMLQ